MFHFVIVNSPEEEEAPFEETGVEEGGSLTGEETDALVAAVDMEERKVGRQEDLPTLLFTAAVALPDTGG